MIGDPRDTGERTLQQRRDTSPSGRGRIRGQLERFVEFDGSPTGALVANNLEWTGGQTALEFLRDVGKHFSVNVMLGPRDGQAAARRRTACPTPSSATCCCRARTTCSSSGGTAARLQIGGSDQWGNIVGGVELSAGSRAPPCTR